MHTAIIRGGWLALVMVGGILLLAGPAWAVSGSSGVEGVVYAAGLCLFPGWLVFLAAAATGGGGDAKVIVGGMLLRIGVVLLGEIVDFVDDI